MSIQYYRRKILESKRRINALQNKIEYYNEQITKLKNRKTTRRYERELEKLEVLNLPSERVVTRKCNGKLFQYRRIQSVAKREKQKMITYYIIQCPKCGKWAAHTIRQTLRTHNFTCRQEACRYKTSMSSKQGKRMKYKLSDVNFAHIQAAELNSQSPP